MAKEQPGHDLDSVGIMTTKQNNKKRAQGTRVSYNAVHTVHLKIPLRVVCRYAGPQYCNKKKTVESYQWDSGQSKSRT